MPAEADAGGPVLAGIRARDIATWPNLFTLVRLACIPLFLWLLRRHHHRVLTP